MFGEPRCEDKHLSAAIVAQNALQSSEKVVETLNATR
jgi:hypothetical protein